MSSKSKALTNKPTVTTVCSSCHRLIVDEVYIRCIKCRDFQQCLQCFSRGLQCEQHIRTHPFVLISKEKKEIYEKGWTIDKEICLLTTLQQHGIDNWDAASYFISTKTPKECKDHYERVYLNHENAPNPKDVSNENPSNYQEKELYLLDGSLSNPSLAATNGTKQKNARDRKKKTYGEVSGFMPKRDEYEYEAIPESEDLIDNIFFSSELDTEDTFKEKLEALVQYSGAVEMRQMMHDFVSANGLHEKTLGSSMDLFDPNSKNSFLATDQEYFSLFLPLCHFFTPEECESIISVLKNEETILEKCNRLQKWIDNDILTHSEGYLYELLNERSDYSDREYFYLSEIANVISNQKEFNDEIINSLLSKAEKEFCMNSGIRAPIYQEVKDELSLAAIKKSDSLAEEEILELQVKNKDCSKSMIIKIAIFLITNGIIAAKGTELLMTSLTQMEADEAEKRKEKVEVMTKGKSTKPKRISTTKKGNANNKTEQRNQVIQIDYPIEEKPLLSTVKLYADDHAAFEARKSDLGDISEVIPITINKNGSEECLENKTSISQECTQERSHISLFSIDNLLNTSITDQHVEKPVSQKPEVIIISDESSDQ